jgi:filamentous hemagglutinin family protein
MKLFLTIGLIQVTLGLNLLSTDLVLAQITPDQTLPVNSVVTPRENTLQIDGGTQAGNNLFHSFKEFSVPIQRSAYFNNTLSIQNIFSRVIGNSISNINGIIKANGTANLFLINPNGIVFGANAALDIGGSFVASTANRLIFSDGFVFSTTESQTNPLLTINVPIGLGFGSSPGQIINQSRATVTFPLIGRVVDPRVAGLQVKNGKTLALVGGDVILQGGNLTANQGRIELGSVAGNNTVSLTPVAKGWQLGYEGVQAFQDIHFFPRTIVDTSGNTGGEIQLQGRQITLAGDQKNSPVFIFSSTVNDGQGGDIIVNASDEINISGSFSGFQTQSEANGTAGNILIETKNLTLTEGAAILSLASLLGEGKAGDISINASEQIEISDVVALSNREVITTAIATTAFSGDGGNLTIQTENLILKDGAQISASTQGNGNAGNIFIDAFDVEINGLTKVCFRAICSDYNSAITAQVEPDFKGNINNLTGNAGSITIETERLKVLNEGFISTTTFGQGQGGKLSISASESILVENQGSIYAVATQGSSGKAGEINLTTKHLVVSQQGLISSQTVGTGDAGNLTLNVERLTLRDGGKIRASSSLLLNRDSFQEDGTQKRGNGGTIIINATDSVEVTTTGNISTQAEGTGNAGDIIVNTDGKLIVAQGGTISADTIATGNAGKINLNVGQLIVQDGSRISSGSLLGNFTPQRGNGGTITINAAESINITNASQLFTLAEGTGNAGDITLNTNGQLSVNQGARITANTFSTGNAGKINLNVGQLLIQNGGEISSGSLLGNNTSNLERDRGGTITINATDSIDISGSLTIDDQTFTSRILTLAQGTGDAGSISLNTNNLSVREGAEINARTENQGKAGSISVTASNLSLEEAAKISVETTSTGDAGDITLNTNDYFIVKKGAAITANTSGTGDAGKITLNTNNFNVQDGAQITTSTTGEGKAGSIFVTTSTFLLSNEGKLLTTTAGIQNAGDIQIQTDNLSLTGLGSGLFANTEENSKGNGGNILVNSQTTNIQNEATISVNSQGTGIGGNITLEGNTLTLNNQASLVAETASSQGGNINLTLNDLLLLRNQSNISATAAQFGDGGNITINAPFILAVPDENSDITANAEGGKGGNINITTQGIFGIQFRNQLTELSDITVTSEFGIQGNFNIINPNTDIINRLVEFPETPVDVASLIAENVCTSDEADRSSFVVTGRGGLPPNPSDPLTQNGTVDWATRSRRDPRSGAQQEPKSPVILKERPQKHQPIIQQIQGWKVAADGTIILTADASAVTPESPILTHPSCQ